MRILLILSACLVLSCTAIEGIDGTAVTPESVEVMAAPIDESVAGGIIPAVVVEDCVEACGDDCCGTAAPHCCDGTDTFVCQPDPC